MALSSSKAQSITPIKAPEFQDNQKHLEKVNYSLSSPINLDLSSKILVEPTTDVLAGVEKDE